jgi:hypothetical protein
MAAFTPSTSSTITPLISVSLPYQVQGVGVSYQQFLNSLGKYNYGVEFFYMWAATYPEIGQPSSLSFTIYPASTVFLKLFVTIAYMGNELDDIGMNNFEEIEAREGVKFFDDFCNYLIDIPQE